MLVSRAHVPADYGCKMEVSRRLIFWLNFLRILPRFGTRYHRFFATVTQGPVHQEYYSKPPVILLPHGYNDFSIFFRGPFSSRLPVHGNDERTLSNFQGGQPFHKNYAAPRYQNNRWNNMYSKLNHVHDSRQWWWAAANDKVRLLHWTLGISEISNHQKTRISYFLATTTLTCWGRYKFNHIGIGLGPLSSHPPTLADRR
jgi:hypothetical protein